MIPRQASAVLPEHVLLSVGRVRATRAWRSTVGRGPAPHRRRTPSAFPTREADGPGPFAAHGSSGPKGGRAMGGPRRGLAPRPPTRPRRSLGEQGPPARSRPACIRHMGTSSAGAGADVDCDGVALDAGTNPACAGSRTHSPSGTISCWDQPRMRGEQGALPNTNNQTVGPTPHARGAGRRHHGQPVDPGTNPACAGSRPPPWSPRSVSRDQPRMRGEQLCTACRDIRGRGPTPHARGAELVSCGSIRRWGGILQLPEIRAFRLPSSPGCAPASAYPS